MEWKRRDLLDLQSLDKEEIELILETAKSFRQVSTRDVKKVPALRGKTVALLFYEASTRTRVSFELAAKRLSADVVNIASSSSSSTKGESILDTALNLEAMNVDMIVVRHYSSGVPYVLSKNLKAAIINAGDGCREHPTQGLLDIFTVQEKLGSVKGRNITIVGDVLHSRVARSNIFGFKKLGANVTVCGPSTLMPRCVKELGVEVSYDLEASMKKSDCVIVLRLQKERQQEVFLPSLREYARLFGLSQSKLDKASKDLLIMHPGPTNRGVEIGADVADGCQSVILEQVTNGLAIRMAVLYLLLGTKELQ
ncbi:MAG: aspartate carbamoyltransferase catalytic subunit [Candidatus Omnitrophica bacterium]|nr:aspartate carbamoyltransferase catalytic subunit [Candidatus Omnitrophota bacterium]